MKELIDRLTSEVGLTEEQAIKAVTMMKDFAKEKFPLLSGAIEKVFTKYSYKKDDEDLPEKRQRSQCSGLSFGQILIVKQRLLASFSRVAALNL